MSVRVIVSARTSHMASEVAALLHEHLDLEDRAWDLSGNCSSVLRWETLSYFSGLLVGYVTEPPEGLNTFRADIYGKDAGAMVRTWVLAELGSEVTENPDVEIYIEELHE